MKSSKRTKEEVAKNLLFLAQEIARLNERLVLLTNARLEEKLDSHSPRWRSLYNEAAAETFCFATKLMYPQNLYALIDAANPADEEDSRTKAERLVGYCSEPLLKVVYRRFVKDVGNDENDFDCFIARLEGDLKREFNFFIKNERGKDRRLGMGFSHQDSRILNDYNRFRESLSQYRKDKTSLSEDNTQKMYLLSHNRFKITPTKLKEVLEGAYKTSVQRDVDLRCDETGEECFVNRIEDKNTYWNQDTMSSSNEKVWKDILHCLEEIYRKKQKRTQVYFSALMTQWVLHQIKGCKFIDNSFISMLHSFSFMDTELLSQFESDGSVPDRQTVLLRFPILKDGEIQLDQHGKPKCKDKGRASNDIKAVIDKVGEMLDKGDFFP